MKKTAFLMVLAFIFVNTAVGAGSNVDLEITKVKTEPTPLQTSEYADVWLKVINRGNKISEDTEIRFNPEFPFSTDPGEKTVWNLGKVFPGEEYRIHLQVKVDENAVHGTNTLSFMVGSGSTTSVEKTVDLEIRTDDEAVTVTEVDFPDKVGPGTSNSMVFKLENNADSYLKNMDITLDISSESLPFITSGTNNRRITKLAPGESRNISYNVAVDEDAENGVYKLPLNIEYENEAGTAFTRSIMTGVVIGGSSELEIGINNKDIERAGSRGQITFRIVNRGEGRAKYAELLIQDSEDYEILSSNSFYIGTVDSDDYQTAEVEMYVRPNISSLTVPVEVSYKDSEGVKRTEVQNIDIDLYSSEQLAMFSNGSGKSFWLYLAAVLIALGGVYYWRKMRKR